MKYHEQLTRMRRFLRDPKAKLWNDELLRTMYNYVQREIASRTDVLESVEVLRTPPAWTWSYQTHWEYAFVEGNAYQCHHEYQQSDHVATQRWEIQQDLGAGVLASDGAMVCHPWESWMSGAHAQPVPWPLPDDFSRMIMIAFDREPLAPWRKKDVTRNDTTWMNRQSIPHAWYRDDLVDNTFFPYPRPAALFDDGPLAKVYEWMFAHAWESDFLVTGSGNDFTFGPLTRTTRHELIGNSGFNVSFSRWTGVVGTLTAVNSLLRMSGTGASHATVRQRINTSNYIGTEFTLTARIVQKGNDDQLTFLVGTSAGDNSLANQVSSDNTVSFRFTPASADTWIQIEASDINSGAYSVDVDDVSIVVTETADWSYVFEWENGNAGSDPFGRGMFLFEVGLVLEGSAVVAIGLETTSVGAIAGGGLVNQENGTAIDSTDDVSQFLMVYKAIPLDIQAGADESVFPEFIQKYIECGTLERAYAANTDGNIESLRGYWAHRHRMGLRVISRWQGLRRTDRDFRLVTQRGRTHRNRRHARLPDEFPPV